MGVAKVIINDVTEIDLTADTVTADVLSEGVTAHDANGVEIVGTLKSGMLYAEYIENGSASITSLPDGITKIADGVFYGQPISITTVPDTVTSIGNYSFSESDITTMTLPDSVTSIGAGVFNNCGALTSIKLPNNRKRLKIRYL